jgi:hypothetical protein
MVVLDTDHLTLLERGRGVGSQVLQDRLDRLDSGSRATTIVTYEEQTRGWVAYMARAKSLAQEIEAYFRLKTHLHSFRRILVLDFDERAGVEYDVPTDETLCGIRAEHGEDARIVMGVWPTKQRFGWLALHLMSHASDRLGTMNFGTGVSFGLLEYLPANLYHGELKNPHYVLWSGKATL